MNSPNISIGFQSLLALNIKFCLLFLRPKWGSHLNISVTPSDFRPLPHPFVIYVIAPSLWNRLLHSACGSVLSSNLSTSLTPYHFLKLISFLRANRTKSASVCLWLLRGAIEILEYNTIQFKR